MTNPLPLDLSLIDGGSQLSFPASRGQSESLFPPDSRPPSNGSTPKSATTSVPTQQLARPSQRSTPTSARGGKHTHNPYGAAALVPSPVPAGLVVGKQSPEDTGSSITSDRDDRPQPPTALSLSHTTEMWPSGPWTCLYRPMLGRLKFVPYPGQSQLASFIPTEDELLRTLKHQLHQRPELSHPVRAREVNLADEVSRLAEELLRRRSQVRIFVGNLWTDLPVGFCQWLLEETHSQLFASALESGRDTPSREQGNTLRAPYLVNASYHQGRSGKFKGCFHATLRCDTDPSLILQQLHQRVLLDRCGYWLAQSAGEMEMLKDYTTDLLEDAKRLKAVGTPNPTSWSLPRSAMSWEPIANQEFSWPDPSNEIQQMKRSRRCLPLPPSLPVAILSKAESSYDRHFLQRGDDD